MNRDGHALRVQLKLAGGEARHWVARIAAEIDFANGLCELHPRKAAAWRPLIARAHAAAEAGAATGGSRALRTAVEQAESILAPLAKTAKSYVVHCVGHAHIDMNWMWSWPETVSVTHDTFNTVLRLMEEYPQFRFSQSQASVYAIIARHNPAMLEAIRRRVAEGRWEVTASHWVEGDKNLAGAESLCRHLLYTRQYMRELFGLAPEDVPVEWVPDSFGHAATMPVYLARGGVKYYYGHRFGIVGEKRPGVFWWQGPDGSRVLVRNDRDNGYNGSLGESLGAQLLRYVRECNVPDFMYVYGVGDHGGGPTRRDLEMGLDMMRWPIFPDIRFSTARAYFERLEAHGGSLPVWTGELNYECTGCYTSQTLIKKINRLGENQLAAAEAAAAFGWAAAGQPYPAGLLTEGWRDALFSHFHDILPGSGVHDTRTYAHGQFQKTAATTNMVETLALRGLAARVDTARIPSTPPAKTPPSLLADGLGAGVGFGTATGLASAAEQSCGSGNRPILVFNPAGHERSEVVVATIWDNDPEYTRWIDGELANRLSNTPFRVVTPDGRELPAQLVESGTYWFHHYAKFAFPVEAVPAFGYGLYTLVEGAATGAAPAEPARITGGQKPCPYMEQDHCDLGLENERIRMRVDPATGGIASLLHKDSGLELVAAGQPAAVLEYAVERPHGMNSWVLADTGPVSLLEVVGIRKKAEGPHLASIEVRLRRGDNRFTVLYELGAGSPLLRMAVNGTWVERGTPETGVPLLRLSLPLALTGTKGRYEVPFGAVDRNLNHGEEVPALQWAQVSGTARGKKAGCLVCNDGKHGHSLQDNTLRVTLVRSSYDPDPLPEVGRQEMSFALVPFAGDLAAADAVRAGNAFNHALRLVGTDVHKGPLPASAGLLTVEGGSVVVCGLKKAEEGHALIVRLFETAGKKTTARIKVNAKAAGRVKAAREVDLMERPQAKSGATLQQGAVRVTVPPRGLVSVLLELERL